MAKQASPAWPYCKVHSGVILDKTSRAKFEDCLRFIKRGAARCGVAIFENTSSSANNNASRSRAHCATCASGVETEGPFSQHCALIDPATFEWLSALRFDRFPLTTAHPFAVRNCLNLSCSSEEPSFDGGDDADTCLCSRKVCRGRRQRRRRPGSFGGRRPRYRACYQREARARQNRAQAHWSRPVRGYYHRLRYRYVQRLLRMDQGCTRSQARAPGRRDPLLRP